MAVYPGGGEGRRCPITTVVADTIDRAIARSTTTDSRIDLRTLLNLIQHELDMQGTLSRSENKHSIAAHFFDAAAEVGRILRVTL
jgi:hypothetical protein